MATEIERKFLVKNPPLYLAEKKVNIIITLTKMLKLVPGGMK